MNDTIILTALILILGIGQMYLFWTLGQILSDLARHEVALLELLRSHPELLYTEEAEIFNDTE